MNHRRIALAFCLLACLAARPGGAADIAILDKLPLPVQPVFSSQAQFAVDSTGAIYLAGSVVESADTRSARLGGTSTKAASGGNPVEVPCGPFPPTLYDIVVAKLTPDASQLLYFTVLGGSRDDQVSALAVDDNGNAYIAGFSESPDFPLGDAPAGAKSPGRDAFVIKLSTEGKRVEQGVFLGGDDKDAATALAVDDQGAAYVAGTTFSPDFPADNALPRPAIAGGVFRSDNGGVSWSRQNNGLSDPRIRQIAADPRREVVYAVTHAGLFRSTDNGTTWQSAGPRPSAEALLTLEIDPQDSDAFYAGTEDGIFRSIDGGASWRPLDGDLPATSRRVTHIRVHPNDSATIYLGTQAGAYKTTDGGVTWKGLSDVLAEVRVLELDPQDPATVYLSHYFPPSGCFIVFPARSTLSRSTDSGTTFVSISEGLSRGGQLPFFDPVVNGLAVDPVQPSTLYTSTSQGTFKSTNGGGEWQASNEGLPADQFSEEVTAGIQQVVIDPGMPARLYALVAPPFRQPGEPMPQGGLFRSDDAGASWQPVDLGEQTPFVRALAIDPTDSSRLYAGTAVAVGRGGFVAKLSASGFVSEFSHVMAGRGDDLPVTIAVDAAGRSYVAGNTSSADLPLLSPLQTSNAGNQDVFAAKFEVEGRPIYSTLLGGTGVDEVQSLAVDPDGNVYLTGKTESTDFPLLNGVRATLSGPSDAFVTKLSGDVPAIEYSGLLGGTGDDYGTGIAVDREGQAYITGVTNSANFPVTAFGAGCSRIGSARSPFATKLNAAGDRVEHSLRLSDSLRSAAQSPQLVLVDEREILIRLDGRTTIEPSPPGPLLEYTGIHFAQLDFAAPGGDIIAPCVVNAASLIAGPLVPGEVVTLYGAGLGPDEFVVNDASATGRYGTELAGVRVLLDGEAVPIVHAQANQISVITPLSLAGKTAATIEVERDGVRTNPRELPVAEAHPGLFTQSFTGIGAAVFNQDWTLNSYEQPAKINSVVEVFVNGGGLTDPPVDPAAFAAPDTALARLRLPVRAFINHFQAPVEFAGTVPGASHGVMQVNIRIPEEIRRQTNARGFHLVVWVGESPTQAAPIVID